MSTKHVKCRLKSCDRSAFGGNRGLCKAHALRVARGWPEDKLEAPFRARGVGPRKATLNDVVSIIRHWAGRYNIPEAQQLADLFEAFDE